MESIEDKIRSIVENPDYSRKEVIANLTTLFTTWSETKSIISDKGHKEKTITAEVEEVPIVDAISEERTTTPKLTKQDLVNILGDLTWTEYEDTDNIISNQLKELEPYFTSSSLHIIETRYILDDDRYRYLSPISSDGLSTLERLTDKSNCQHKNTYYSNMKVCLDCDEFLNDD